MPITTLHRLPLLALLALPAAGVQAQTDAPLLSTDFNSGIPAAFITRSYDAMGVKSSFFRNLPNLSNTWFGGAGLDGNFTGAALSCSRRQEVMPTDDWLITPELDLSGSDLWLAWEARSVHRHYPENYRVMISTAGTDPADFEPLADITAEGYRWQHHLLNLEKWRGQKVHIAFVHTTTDGFLLAIDNLFVGQPSKAAFASHDLTRHSCAPDADGTAPVSGTFRNLGPSFSLASIDVTLGDGTRITHAEAATLATGEEKHYSLPIPVTEGKSTNYRVEAVATDGQRYPLAADSVICTAYPRTLLLEKLTAYWCNNCPALDPFIYELEDRLDSQFVEVVVQYPANNGQDPGKLTCPTFLKGLTTYNLPTIFYNRLTANPQYSNDDRRALLKALARPCTAYLTLNSAVSDGKTITLTASGEFASALDNASDRYRVGVTLLEREAQTQIYQENSSMLPELGEYYYMPTRIRQPLARFSRVARGTDVAFTGIAGSYPAAIEARTPYATTYSFAIPEGVTDASAANLEVVAYILDTSRREVLNAARIAVSPASVQGINDAVSGSEALRPTVSQGDGRLTITFPAGTTGTATLLRTDGTAVARSSQAAARQTFTTAGLGQGCYLLTTTTADGASHTAKVVLTH